MDKPKLPIDIYVRVSRVGKRDGESFSSPEDQERDGRAFLEARKLPVGLVLPHDLDESGSTLDRPGLQEGLRRVETGLSGGLVVAYLSRASRDTRQGLDLLDQITRANGAVYAPNLPDYTTADGKMLTTIQLAIDTGYRERKREEFERAKKGAIERGIPVHTRPAVGYRAKADRRLEPVPSIAPVVREVFERAASGNGPVALGRFLEERGVPTSQGSRVWSKQAIYGLLRNRVYLGELSYGRDRRFVNPAAHEPIVDLATWLAAQQPTLKRLAPRRSEASTYLLAGILRCHACGYSLQGTTTTRRKRIYRCTRRHAGGLCPAPATVLADLVESAAVDAFWRLTDDLRAEGTPDVAGELHKLERALERAEHALTQWASPEMQEALGDDLATYASGVRKRREARDLAAEKLGRTRAESDSLHALMDQPSETLRQAWERMTTAERRELLGLRFDCLALRRDRTITVFPSGTGPADLPRRGYRRDPKLARLPDPPRGTRVLAF